MQDDKENIYRSTTFTVSLPPYKEPYKQSLFGGVFELITRVLKITFSLFIVFYVVVKKTLHWIFKPKQWRYVLYYLAIALPHLLGSFWMGWVIYFYANDPHPMVTAFVFGPMAWLILIMLLIVVPLMFLDMLNYWDVMDHDFFHPKGTVKNWLQTGERRLIHDHVGKIIW